MQKSRTLIYIKGLVCGIFMLLITFFALFVPSVTKIDAQTQYAYLSENWFGCLDITKEQITEIHLTTELPPEVEILTGVNVAAGDEFGKSFDGTTLEILAYTISDIDGIKVYMVCDGIIYAPQNSSSLFENLTNLKTIKFNNFNTSKVITYNKMFNGCASLQTLDLSTFNTQKVVSTDYMFKDCLQLEGIDLSNFDTQCLVSMSGMFKGCSGLKTLNISNFNVSNVLYLDEFVSGCFNLEDLKLGEFYCPSVVYVEAMFNNCLKLKNVNLCNMYISKVLSLKNMFYGCKSLKSLNISNFETTSVYNMQNMFYNCASLEELDLSKFDMQSVLYNRADNMLYGTYNLVKLKLPYNVKTTIKLAKKMTLTNHDNKPITYTEINPENCAKQGNVLTLTAYNNKVEIALIISIITSVILVANLAIILIKKTIKIKK